MKNKTLRRFLRLALLVLLLLISTVIAFAEERGEQRNEDYKANLLWQDDFSKVKTLTTSKSMASYLTYLKKVSGNDILAIAPGISGINSDHVYLSYRSNTQGSAQMIYTGKTSATAPESPCTTDFITLDFDFSAERGIPDGMSVSLNGRAFKDDGSTSASGSAYVFFRDRDGILEIATDNADGSYRSTSICIFEEFVHITVVLDLREVHSNGADAIRAYAYANGVYMGEVSHGFTDKTDIINEIRFDFGTERMHAELTDTVLLDNLLMRSFDSDYSGNLGAILENPSRSLLDFDCGVYSEEYKLPTSEKTKIAKCGVNDYYNLGDILSEVKSTEVVRLLVESGTRPSATVFTLHYLDSVTSLQSDGVKYSVFDKDGNILADYTSDNDFGLALQSLQILGGTVEMYADIQSTSTIFSGTTANDGTDLGESNSYTTTRVTFSFNGYTLSIGTDNWLKLSTQQGVKNLSFVGPGCIASESIKAFSISIGSAKSTVDFKDLSISVPHSFITGQTGVYTFSGCEITWTQDLSSESLGFVSGFGGPTRGGVTPSLSFKDCYIHHDVTVKPNATRSPFIVTQCVKTATKENPITTVINIEGCTVDIVNNLWFANANNGAEYSPNMLKPTPTLNIIDSDIKAWALGSAYNGNFLTVNVSGNSNLTLTKAAVASGEKSITYSDGSSAVYTSEVLVNLGDGVSMNLRPISENNVNFTLDGRLLSLIDASGYIVANPTLKANISLGSDFDFNFYVPKDIFVAASVDGVRLTIGNEIEVDGKIYLTLTYQGISPSDAGISKSVLFTFTTGKQEYNAKYSASIPKYIQSVLKNADGQNNDAERSKPLLRAIVLYIDCAYRYFEKSEGEESIYELLSLTKDIPTASVDFNSLVPTNSLSALSFALSETALSLKSTPKVRFKLSSNYTGEIFFDNVSYTIENGLHEGRDYIDISLTARGILRTIKIQANGVKSEFNIASYYRYLKENQDNEEIAKAIPLVEALFTYGKSADVFVDHIFDEGYKSNKTHHWHACQDAQCILITGKAEHDFTNGVCVCGESILREDGEGEFLMGLGISQNIKTEILGMEFAKVLKNTTVTYMFSELEKSKVKSGDMLLFSFVVRAEVSTPIEITVDVGTTINHQNSSKTMTYYVPSQWTRIYLPIVNNGMSRVSLKTDGVIYIAEAKYENREGATQKDLELQSGMWMLDEFESYDVSASTLGAGATIDLVAYSDFIYSIGGGKLTIIDRRTDSVRSTLSGFGTLRQIDVSDDGRFVVITGRADGVYIVNVEDPTSPRIVSTYNSIEMATGLYVSGDYAFICNRQYGVEVVDISDPYQPKHLANIHSGEVQSCVVYKNILYAGVWGQCGVFMYDLSSLSDSAELECIGTVTTNGKGDGMSVIERDERIYLFAATGQHTYSASTSSPLDNLCYGQGNGLDIYDVTTPSSPRWIATAKIDGRYYYTANDYWECEVGYDEKTGKYYAYLVNTYNGVYIFDVTSIDAPRRLAHLEIILPLGDSIPALKHDSRAIITTWDQTKSNRSPVGAILVSDGKMYIGGTSSDIHIFENSSYLFAPIEGESRPASFDNVKDDFYDFKNVLTDGTLTQLASGSYQFISTTGQVLGIATSGEYIYVAAGIEGVLIYDKATLKCVKAITPTSVGGRVGFANGLKVYENKLYVASDIAGLQVYDVSGDYADNPALLWSYKSSNKIAREVVISPDGLFSVVAYNNNGIWVIDNTTHKLTKSFTTSGTMYHHNIGALIDNRYLAFYGHSGDEHWLDFGPEGARYDLPQEVKFSGNLGMTGGVCEIVIDGKAYALKIGSRGALYTDNYTKNTGTQIAEISAVGKPTVCGNYLFISERISGTVSIYDISYLTDPTSTATGATLIGTLRVNGNPDIISTDGTTVYIPLGYQGLLIIDTTKAFTPFN